MHGTITVKTQVKSSQVTDVFIQRLQMFLCNFVTFCVFNLLFYFNVFCIYVLVNPAKFLN